MFTDSATVVLIDTPYLYHSALSIKPGAKVDYGKLMVLIRETHDIITNRTIAFVLDTQGKDKGFHNFIKRLEDLGIDVEMIVPRQGQGGKPKTDCSIPLCIEAMTIATPGNSIIIVSGDGAYIPLVQRLKARGVRVGIAGYKKSTSRELKEECNEFIELDEEILRREEQ